MLIAVFTSGHVVKKTFFVVSKRRPKSDQKGNTSLLKDHGLFKKGWVEDTVSPLSLSQKHTGRKIPCLKWDKKKTKDANPTFIGNMN